MDEACPDDMGGRLARELDDVRLELEALAGALCVEPVMLERHGADLQRFDRLAQTIDEVARLLRRRGSADDPTGAIRLDAMAERLAGARW